MDIDWTSLADTLFQLVAADLKRFAAQHRGEKFYGFAFDCNSEYGQVLLCLNTNESLGRRVAEYLTKPPLQDAFDQIERRMEEKLGGKLKFERAPKTPEEQENELRWSMGDWKYQGFSSEHFDQGWSPLESALADAYDEEEEDEDTFKRPTQHRFMEVACEVLIRLESTGSFDVLNRTPDFKTYAADHDEDESVSWARLQNVRDRIAR